MNATMNCMTEAQWGRLFVALGQVPAIDVAMNLDRRETRALHELAMKGADAAQRRFLHYGDGDKLDALDLAQKLGIDPQTAEIKPALTDEELARDAAQDRFDRYLDDLAHAGE
ncbi:hypothetical protein THICB2_590122 [Thiomonas sp. CB2]|jgi:hypothetical protein|nr:hypothetical protein THICB2_590122 [Thiomonas sp. CB2]VDY03939.1 protein of unknown function [Thiomonas sp. Bio17B3]VDY08890.1 protein of unknown function [Thiomonas sp. Sup16B3]VDY12186.1 conserved protein of unknown function [Thiomonas sp. OC7]VDY18600.1 protein of unknown function [Thiomonas sp. CB2]